VWAVDFRRAENLIAYPYRGDEKRFVVHADEMSAALSGDYRGPRKMPCDNDPFLAIV